MTDEAADTSARTALRRHQLRPRKSLGQNFLRDRSYLARILSALDLTDEDDVLEIGPGTGVLTHGLVRCARRVVAVELDPHLVAALRADFASAPNVQIVEGDALQFDPAACFPGPYKLAGNIPYYITGPLLRHYLELRESPVVLVLMVQREVADRLVAGPGDLSLLGLSVQFYATAKVVARVPRRAFHPVPNVDSAIVKIVPHAPAVPTSQRGDFFRLARAGFGTRRKTLGNALSIGLNIPREDARKLLDRAGIEEGRRAETLSLDEWVQLTAAFTSPGE